MPQADAKAITSVRLCISGLLCSMKNRRRMVRNKQTGKMIPLLSEEAARYMQDFCRQVPSEYRNLRLGSLTGPLRLICTVYYQSRRSDLDVALLLDCLQTAEVIANDRFVIEQHLYAEVDAKNPRCEITLEEL